MADAPRERVTIDLCGLAPALKAQAKARHLTVSQVARLALVAALPSAPEKPPPEPDGREVDRLVKLTIRLRRTVAARLAERARTAGLSRGGYLTTLIDGAPAPPLALVKALAASTDRLTLIAADANEVIRLLRKDAAPSEEPIQSVVRSMVDNTRQHLELASRIVAELRPTRKYTPRPRRRAVRASSGT